MRIYCSLKSVVIELTSCLMGLPCIELTSCLMGLPCIELTSCLMGFPCIELTSCLMGLPCIELTSCLMGLPCIELTSSLMGLPCIELTSSLNQLSSAPSILTSSLPRSSLRLGGWHVNTIAVIGGFPLLILCASIATVVLVEHTCILIAGSTGALLDVGALCALARNRTFALSCGETELLLLILLPYLVCVHCQRGRTHLQSHCEERWSSLDVGALCALARDRFFALSCGETELLLLILPPYLVWVHCHYGRNRCTHYVARGI